MIENHPDLPKLKELVKQEDLAFLYSFGGSGCRISLILPINPHKSPCVFLQAQATSTIHLSVGHLLGLTLSTVANAWLFPAYLFTCSSLDPQLSRTEHRGTSEETISTQSCYKGSSAQCAQQVVCWC